MILFSKNANLNLTVFTYGKIYNQLESAFVK